MKFWATLIIVRLISKLFAKVLLVTVSLESAVAKLLVIFMTKNEARVTASGLRVQNF